jgi:hypothetical protein
LIGYASQAVAVVLLYGLFALSSLAVAALIRPLSRSPENAPILLTGCAITGPTVLGLMLWIAMWISPGLDRSACIALVAVVPIAILLIRARSFYSELRELISQVHFPSVLVLIACGLLFFVVLLLALQLFFLPLHGNDPLEYMQLGRVFWASRDAHLYPILTGDRTGGFIAPWTHPPTYAVLIGLAFMLQGSASIAGAAKLVGLWFAVGTAALCGALVRTADRRMSWRALVVPFFILSVPLYFQLVQSAHIDAFRIATFTLAVAWTIAALTQPTCGSFVLAGVGTGLAALSHSIGVLVPFIVGALAIVSWQGNIHALAVRLLLMGGIAGAAALPHYLRNTLIFGSPIQDSVPIWEIPELGVRAFLRASRGLETLADRLYHGVFMPFTRIQEFGWLPTALLVISLALGAAIWRLGVRRTAETVIAHRQTSIATQLTLTVIGYFGFVFLTALGTELAIKNARYLLTIVPLAVALLAILLGKLFTDELIVRTPAAALAGLSRRVLRSAGHAEGAAARAQPDLRRSRAGPLLVVGVVLAIAAVQLMGTLRFSVTNVAVYLGWPVSLGRLLESELMKRDGSLLPDAAVERIARRIVAPDEVVLAFRQASIGFYPSASFRFHVDAALGDLFRELDPEALARRLRQHGFSWLYLPDFPLPEVQNSAFAALLRNGNLVRSDARVEGWSLFQLLDGATTVDGVVVARAVPAAGPGHLISATTEQGPGMVDGRRARLTVDEYRGVAELSRDRGLVRQLGRWDVIMSRPVRTNMNPELVNAIDFVVPSATRLLLRAWLSGRGLAELVVEYERVAPPSELTDQALFPNEDGQGVGTVQREVVWSGTLSSEKQEIGGWLNSATLTRSGAERQGARLLFRLRDGDTLRLHGWEVLEHKYEGFPLLGDPLISALQRGWLIKADERFLLAGLGVRALHQTSGLAASKNGGIGMGVAVDRSTTGSASLSPPVFRLSNDTERTETETKKGQLQLLTSQGNLGLHVRTELVGFGAVSPTLAYVCSGQGSDTPTSSWRLFGLFSSARERVHRASLQPTFLHAGEPSKLEWVVRLPCIPSAARLILDSHFVNLLTFERFLTDPDAARRGSVGVLSMHMQLNAISADGLAPVLLPPPSVEARQSLP